MIHKLTNSIETYYWLKKTSHTCPYSISYHPRRLNLIIRLLHWFTIIRIDSIKSKTNYLLISNESLLIFLHLFSGRISLSMSTYKLIWMKIIKMIKKIHKIISCWNHQQKLINNHSHQKQTKILLNKHKSSIKKYRHKYKNKTKS